MNNAEGNPEEGKQDIILICQRSQPPILACISASVSFPSGGLPENEKPGGQKANLEFVISKAGNKFLLLPLTYISSLLFVLLLSDLAAGITFVKDLSG
jgi:hypothetical protein